MTYHLPGKHSCIAQRTQGSLESLESLIFFTLSLKSLPDLARNLDTSCIEPFMGLLIVRFPRLTTAKEALPTIKVHIWIQVIHRNTWKLRLTPVTNNRV